MKNYYVITFTGKEEIVALLEAYNVREMDTLGEARDKRRAVEILFGDEAGVVIDGFSERSL